MKIASPANDRIIVELSCKDMRELDITYEEMDYSADRTRRAIRCVLDAAEKALGIELDLSRRMMIEAMPEESGGCILSFTILERRRLCAPERQSGGYIMCGFDSAEELLDCIGTLPRPESCPESSLYESGGKYRLLIKCSGEDNGLLNHLKEFCSELSSDSADCGFTAEHWSLVTEKSAIQSVMKFS